FIAQKLIKMLIARELPVKGAKVGVLGLTFKENVPDLRNSRVPDILRELSEFGVTALVHDPLADAAEARHEYGVELAQEGDLRELDALVVAVGHREYLQRLDAIQAFVRQGGVLIDVKSCVDPSAVRGDLAYWSL
ncbi:MAG: nucleotide sugar dehydrogenase, partial [Myxococcota bacterium]|nr:nucleotide sugar dehydrogenase [Myxococcota bacterium]